MVLFYYIYSLCGFSTFVVPFLVKMVPWGEKGEIEGTFGITATADSRRVRSTVRSRVRGHLWVWYRASSRRRKPRAVVGGRDTRRGGVLSLRESALTPRLIPRSTIAGSERVTRIEPVDRYDRTDRRTPCRGRGYSGTLLYHSRVLPVFAVVIQYSSIQRTRSI